MDADREVDLRFLDGTEGCLGTVLDLSLSGARIRVGIPIEIGKKFDMSFDSRQQIFRCTVVRSTDSEIGVTFDTDVS
jgi:hypothetical protein